jgi:hypothetical protein
LAGQQPVDDELKEQIDEVIMDCLNTSFNGGILNPLDHDFKDICVENIMQLFTAYADRRADKRVEEASIKAEIKGKIEALDKMVMGAGEYHDDPYEYVVRLSDLREYRAKLAQFDLSQPIFRDATHHPKGGSNAKD